MIDYISTYIPDYTVFDLETTGLGKHCEIIEISAVKIRDRKIADKFSTLVKPSVPIPIQASSIHHITDDMVNSAMSPEEAITQFCNFIKHDRLVGHNITSFDLPIVRRCAFKYNKVIRNDHVDTVTFARQKLPHLSSRSLESLAEYYNVPYKNAHRGLTDSLINYHVYEHLIWTPIPEGETEIQKCPLCQSDLKLRVGQYGRFFGCSNYPKCRFTQPYPTK